MGAEADADEADVGRRIGRCGEAVRLLTSAATSGFTKRFGHSRGRCSSSAPVSEINRDQHS